MLAVKNALKLLKFSHSLEGGGSVESAKYKNSVCN